MRRVNLGLSLVILGAAIPALVRAQPALPSAAPAPSPSAPPESAPSAPQDVDLQLETQRGGAHGADAAQDANEQGAPTTLPRELRRNLPPSARAQVSDSSGPLTIEDIDQSPVVSASRHKETTLAAPAFVVVLTAKDLHDRGYTDLSQILDDLPGMDVIRPYGSVYVKSYWRGYRQDVGADPYLLMLDGVVYNSLFYGDTQILATFPISEIDHVEIVYGPASAAYGPNATMGVINVITKDADKRLESGDNGSFLTSRITFGGAQRNLSSFAASTKQVDATFSYLTKDIRLRVATLVSNGSLDSGVANGFEYSRSSYYADPRLWGTDSLDEVDGEGTFGSVDKKYGVDVRLNVGNTEFAGQFFQLGTGLGTLYPADRIQSSSPWTTREISAYARHVERLGPNATSTTFVQYRESGVVSPSSVVVSAYGDAGLGRSFGVVPTTVPSGAGGLSPYALFFSVEAPNSAIVAQQDFSFDIGKNLFLEGDELQVDSGVRYEHLRYSFDFGFTSLEAFPVGGRAPGAAASLLPSGSPLTDASNASDADEVGAYVLGTYNFPKNNALHLGGRLDNPPLTSGVQPTIRGGYVGTFEPFTVKALYGQAVYAPGPYDLIAANVRRATLTAESSQTLESDVEFRMWKLGLHGDAYYIMDANPIIAGQNGANRTMSGLDFGARLIAPPFNVWAYYSRLLTAEESGQGGAPNAPIGDLAFDKVWAGVTFDRGPFTATVLARWMGPRPTVPTNPIATVPAYFTVDANIVASHLFFDPLWAGLRVTNILNTAYTQPGIASADSGNAQGVFFGGGYSGSGGPYSSLLPQPGRSAFLTLGLDM